VISPIIASVEMADSAEDDPGHVDSGPDAVGDKFSDKEALLGRHRKEKKELQGLLPFCQLNRKKL